MENRKVNVKAHKRFDPRINKKVDVDSYDKNQRFTQYKSNINSGLPLAKGLTANNIGYIQYKILELIKLNANYDTETTMDDLYDELTFGIEDGNDVKDMVENLRSQGLLNNQSLTPTKEGNRIFWEFFKENDEDNESVELLKDNPYLKKEGFEIIGSKEYPNETLLYLKDLDKEADRIEKQLRSNIKFKKSHGKSRKKMYPTKRKDIKGMSKTRTEPMSKLQRQSYRKLGKVANKTPYAKAYKKK